MDDINAASAAGATAGSIAGSIAGAAGAAETVLENVMKVEPMVAGIAGMFVPGLSVVQPWIVLIAPYLEQALDDLSKGNNGDALTGLMQLIQHISKNGANSPILSSNTASASAQGSG